MKAMNRRFNSLASLGKFLETRKTAMVPVGKLIIGASARVMYDKVRSMHGSHALADLAPATQEDRIEKGYTPNDPLKRDGSLLRDSVEMEAGFDFAAVGSSEPAAAAHEYGYQTRPFGNPNPEPVDVPARPVYKLGLEESIPLVMRIAESNIGRLLGFGMVDDEAPMLPGVGPDISGSINT
jgi:phage gpG-like protein